MGSDVFRADRCLLCSRENFNAFGLVFSLYEQIKTHRKKLAGPTSKTQRDFIFTTYEANGIAIAVGIFGSRFFSTSEIQFYLLGYILTNINCIYLFLF